MFRYTYTKFSQKLIKRLVVLALITLLTGCQHGMLSPRGIIADDQRKLFFDALGLMLIVVLPVIIMSIVFALKYRKSNSKDKNYNPNWSHNTLLEVFWWGIPMVIVLILGIFAWNKSHTLDPYKKLKVQGRPVIIKAIALRWKWLFVYPSQNIATLNYVNLPEKRPVEFQITADAPMSSFFIPRLGGQIYAMAGMRTFLHLYSSFPGVYEGLNAQYNGNGFSDMHFKAHVLTQAKFMRWIREFHNTKHLDLNLLTYKFLRKPTVNAKPHDYNLVVDHLFEKIIKIYMQNNPLN